MRLEKQDRREEKWVWRSRDCNIEATKIGWLITVG